MVRDWFPTYERDDLARVYVTEEFIPVQSMGMRLALVTMDEGDLFPEKDDDIRR